MKERVVMLPDFWDSGRYFFEDFIVFDEKTVAKKWDTGKKALFHELLSQLEALPVFETETIHGALEGWMTEKALKPGDLFPLLRIALIGTMKGPGVPEMLALFGFQESKRRLLQAAAQFDTVQSA
jgi:glutamyl-tRNA synthetase